MPSVLIIDDLSTFPKARKPTRWSDLAAKLAQQNFSVTFVGVEEGALPDLQAPTEMGTVREAIDIADLVIVGQNANPGLALWTVARRGGGGQSVVAVYGWGTLNISADLWPPRGEGTLQVVRDTECGAAVDRVLGTRVAQTNAVILDPPVLPVSLAPAPTAYARCGTGALEDDALVAEIGGRVMDHFPYHGTPRGRILTGAVESLMRQAIFVAIARNDPAMLAEALEVVRHANDPRGGAVGHGHGLGTLPTDWALYQLALYCPEPMLAGLEEGLLMALWARVPADNVVAPAAALRREGRLLETLRQHRPDHAATERLVTEAVEEDEPRAMHLGTIPQFFRVGGSILHQPSRYRSLALASLGCFRVPDILQMEESIPAAVANAHYLVAGGQAHGFPRLIRELSGMVANRVWANKDVQRAVMTAVELCPPRDATEMAEWDDLIRGTGSKSLRNAILSGIEAWPMVSGALTDLIGQRLQATGGGLYEDSLGTLARRTLDPARRDVFVTEAAAWKAERRAGREARVGGMLRGQR